MAVSANNRFHFPPSPCPWRGPGVPLAAERGPAQPGGRPAHLLLLHLPRPSPSLRKRLGLPRPPHFLRWKNKGRLAGRQVLPGGQPRRPPALPALALPCVRCCRGSAARPGPRLAQLPPSRPRLWAECSVVRLLLTDPPQQRSAARGSGSLVSFSFKIVFVVIIVSFWPLPPQFLCRQLLPPHLGRQQKSNPCRPWCPCRQRSSRQPVLPEARKQQNGRNL